MIRAIFHINPYALSDTEWAERFAEAAWIEGTRLRNLARRLAELFSDSDA